MLTEPVIQSIENSVLCWLATVSVDNIPNVSPKEIFAAYGEEKIIVANIASPQSVKNIKNNADACISFIDILVQKGYQIKGKGRIIDKAQTEFSGMEHILEKMTEGKFPFASIIEIRVTSIKSIIAPKYILYPETTEEDQIESAKKMYGF
ncbi:predicted flavin-nucleotide-binding protein [Flavobacteriales bacterium ALC-1]|nr:predicted flavin-nucleotide-binding protein [Flavobacteriales bacterium ALC-1]